MYAGTLALDVPANAAGNYTISFIDVETFATDPELEDIPLLAEIPGVVQIPCSMDSHCIDQDECTFDYCDLGACFNVILWEIVDYCCDPATGQIWNRPRDTDCATHVCGDEPDELITTFAPEGTACDTQDPCTANGVCNTQGRCQGTHDPGPACPKPRYITLAPADTGGPTAIRATLVALNRPNPVYDNGNQGGNFAAFEGQYRWVGPAGDCTDGLSGPAFKCAKLQCSPHYEDWPAILAGEPLHVTGDAVIPSSIYAVDQLDVSCQGTEDVCGLVTPEPIARTGRWGNVEGPFLPAEEFELTPDVIDIGVQVNKLKEIAGSVPKPRSQLSANDVDPQASITVLEVGHTVDAVKGQHYPFSGPTPCTP